MHTDSCFLKLGELGRLLFKFFAIFFALSNLFRNFAPSVVVHLWTAGGLIYEKDVFIRLSL